MSGFLRSAGKIVLGISMIPAAVLLMKKHTEISVDGKRSRLYTFGKKGGPAKAVFVTNQTPAKAVKKAVNIIGKKS